MTRQDDLSAFAAWVVAAAAALRPQDLERFRREVRRRAEALGIEWPADRPDLVTR